MVEEAMLHSVLVGGVLHPDVEETELIHDADMAQTYDITDMGGILQNEK